MVWLLKNIVMLLFFLWYREMKLRLLSFFLWWLVIVILVGYFSDRLLELVWNVCVGRFLIVLLFFVLWIVVY